MLIKWLRSLSRKKKAPPGLQWYVIDGMYVLADPKDIKRIIKLSLRYQENMGVKDV